MEPVTRASHAVGTEKRPKWFQRGQTPELHTGTEWQLQNKQIIRVPHNSFSVTQGIWHMAQKLTGAQGKHKTIKICCDYAHELNDWRLCSEWGLYSPKLCNSMKSIRGLPNSNLFVWCVIHYTCHPSEMIHVQHDHVTM